MILDLLEMPSNATSGALQYWNIAFKRPKIVNFLR
jgi:hypothetical protein